VLGTEVETARLLLRPWQPGDLTEFTRLLTDPVVTRYIVVSTPFSSEDVAELSARTLEQWERNGFGPWAAIEKATGRWVGRVGLDELADWPGPHKIDVGWELHREFWGRGLATEGGRAGGPPRVRGSRVKADHQCHHGDQCRVPAGDGEVRPTLPGRAGHGRNDGGLVRDRPSRLAKHPGASRVIGTLLADSCERASGTAPVPP
jgi:Acetyltransferase (GNAT) domain